MSALSLMGAMPGFRVPLEDDVPGFRVTPQTIVPGFNLDPNGLRRREPNWFSGMHLGATRQDSDAAQPFDSRTPTPEYGTFFRSAPTVLPDWLNNLLSMPLPKVSDAFDSVSVFPITARLSL